VSDPSNPTELGKVVLPGSPLNLAVKDNLVYIAAFDAGLRIIDVSDPANPSQVGFFDTVEGTVFPIFDLASDVAVSGDFAYVVDQTDGVRIINVSDPANPAEVGFFDNDTSSFRQVTVIGDFVYLTEFQGLRIIFVANPASPIEVGFLKLRGFGRTVTVDGDMAYVADTIGMRIIDVSNFASPKAVGFFETGDTPYAITVNGEYAYLAAQLTGLQIFDVSNPRNPNFVSSFSYEDCYDCGRDVALKGDLAYLVGEVGLRIINVSDPANPAEVGGIVTEGFPLAVAVSGNYAYVAALEGGLRIIDVSSPQSPTEVGFFANAINEDVVVRDNLAFVAGFDAGLRIIDVSNPASPVEAGFLDTEGYAFGVAVKRMFWCAYVHCSLHKPAPNFPRSFCRQRGEVQYALRRKIASQSVFDCGNIHNSLALGR
jgi:hypothetical protein